ncbi:MAG TPA: methyltransferase domain-containing protein [Candidatus Polarisedimenticolaceae bacterium]|nr:methyltransferase domain-containing protein [Candidatus Polarisedimenticolaceae bacterium]
MRLVPDRRDDAEWIDRPDNTVADLRAAFGDIGWTHRWLGGRAVLLSALGPYLDRSDGPLRILDVGTGAADLPLAIIAWARRLGRPVEVVGLDRDFGVTSIAAGAAAGCAELTVVCADARRLPFDDRSFDLVTASLFLHHFGPGEWIKLLGGFRRVARRAVVVCDLRRHLLPWVFLAGLARLTRRHPMFVHDAPLSVLRGFTDRELLDAATACGASSVSLRRRWPFRLLLTIRVEGEAA